MIEILKLFGVKTTKKNWSEFWKFTYYREQMSRDFAKDWTSAEFFVFRFFRLEVDYKTYGLCFFQKVKE